MTLEFFYGFKTAARRAGWAGSFAGSGDKKHTYLTDCADPKSIPRNRTAVNSLEIPGCTMVAPWCVHVHAHLSREDTGCTHTQLCTHVCTHTVMYTRILAGVPVLIRYRYWMENPVRILKIRFFLADRCMSGVRSCWIPPEGFYPKTSWLHRYQRFVF